MSPAGTVREMRRMYPYFRSQGHGRRASLVGAVTWTRWAPLVNFGRAAGELAAWRPRPTRWTRRPRLTLPGKGGWSFHPIARRPWLMYVNPVTGHAVSATASWWPWELLDLPRRVLGMRRRQEEDLEFQELVRQDRHRGRVNIYRSRG